MNTYKNLEKNSTKNKNQLTKVNCIKSNIIKKKKLNTIVSYNIHYYSIIILNILCIKNIIDT